jgi:hypothetical protein
MSSDREKTAERLILQEVNNLSLGPNEVKQNGCAACHVLFTLADKMQISETEAADLLAEILLGNPHLNDQFIEMVENIHMKQRLMGGGFSMKTREAKDRFIDSNLKAVLAEFSADLVNYGLDIVLRKLLMSSISLEIAQTIGSIIMPLLKNSITICGRKIRKHMHRSLILLTVSVRKQIEASYEIFYT